MHTTLHPRPVFVLGSPRSGTTLLYHMLLSSGGFAVFRAESHVFDAFGPRFGALRSPADRRRALAEWLSTKHFRISGLDADDFRARILRDCRSAGDFLRIFMEAIAERQGADRWADCTPAHLLWIDRIKAEMPDALILHIIRDGRDVALSLDRQGWLEPLPWDRSRGVVAAGIYWAWLVRRGRTLGRRLERDYLEVRFEDLVRRTQPALDRIGRFIDHDLDWEAILRNGIGSVRRPNTSFGDGVRRGGRPFDPVGRWRRSLSDHELEALEAAIGDLLDELGYESSAESADPARRLRWEIAGGAYEALFSAKHWLKTRTPLGRAFTGLEHLRRY